jgi:pyrroline-5-carboxylate reductase
MKLAMGDKKVCFVGAGAMAEAIFRGMIGKEVARPEQIQVTNRRDMARLQDLHVKYGVQVPADADAADRFISEADIVVLAMKPVQVDDAAVRLAGLLRPEQLVVSVIVGMTTEAIERRLGMELPVARTMPNTSSTIGRGATGITFNERVTEEQRALTETMFRAVGIVEEVDEPMLDVVTSVSGSGPAYVYYMMEAMIRSGVEAGLDEDQARRLTAETVLGAATMVKVTNQLPQDLRRKVTSPNGSTHAAIERLREHNFQRTVADAMDCCVERARELGDMLK